MKLTVSTIVLSLTAATAAIGNVAAGFVPGCQTKTTFFEGMQSRAVPLSSSSVLYMTEIRPPSQKAEVLRFGWDGTTALGGAVEIAKPARMLDAIRAAGETIPSECDVFNANIEMDGSDLMMEDVLELINTHYETQLLEYTVGDVVNKQGENEATGQILSYAALSNMDKETTLKLWGQHYRAVRANPDGVDHANIRNFMKYGWDGVPFENGIALTRKNVGEGEWDAFAESWIP